MEQYIKNYIERIRTVNTDIELETIINSIYDDGFSSGGDYPIECDRD